MAGIVEYDIQTKVGRIEQKLDSLTQRLTEDRNDGLDGLFARVSRLENRVDRLNARLDGLLRANPGIHSGD